MPPLCFARSGGLRPEINERLVLCMAFNGECDAELLSEVLWPDPDLMPDGWYDTLRRRLFLLRRALLPLGWTVANRPGYGWRLKPL